MSTPSLIGTIAANGSIDARMVNYDGNPMSMVPVLAKLAETRGGLAAVASAILSTTRYWMSLDSRFPIIKGLGPVQESWRNLPFFSPERNAHEVSKGGRTVVPGVGMHSTEDGVVNGQMMDGLLSTYAGAAWGYLLAEDGTLVVLGWKSNGMLEEIARFPGAELAGLTKEQLATVECGEKFESCNHHAWFHDEAARGSQLTMRVWLGFEPLRVEDAIGLTVGDFTYEITGSGRGSSTVWHSWSKGPNGEPAEVSFPIVKGKRKAPKTGTLVYPPTRATVAA